MARPTKQTIDHFPLDVNFDNKFEFFITGNGPESLGVLVTDWQLIYGGQGYFVEYSDKRSGLRVPTDSTAQIIHPAEAV